MQPRRNEVDVSFISLSGTYMTSTGWTTRLQKAWGAHPTGPAACIILHPDLVDWDRQGAVEVVDGHTIKRGTVVEELGGCLPASARTETAP